MLLFGSGEWCRWRRLRMDKKMQMKKISLVFVGAVVLTMVSCPMLIEEYTISRANNKITDCNLQNYVPVPVGGARAVKDLARPDLVVSVLWQDEKGAALEMG